MNQPHTDSLSGSHDQGEAHEQIRKRFQTTDVVYVASMLAAFVAGCGDDSTTGAGPGIALGAGNGTGVGAPARSAPVNLGMRQFRDSGPISGDRRSDFRGDRGCEA